MEEQKKTSNAIWVVVAVAVVAVAAVGGWMWASSPERTGGSATERTPASPTRRVNGNATLPAPMEIRDGTYTAEGNYQSPGGAEKIGVTLTVTGGVVTEATVQTRATLAASMRYQELFGENFRQQVVGKPIAGLKLDKVAGSSLTPRGFNDAVEKILRQARM